MYFATNPLKCCTVSATHFWYAEMTSRRSSGSMRADSAVEPTRSENITVTWRRSAASLGATATVAGAGAAVFASERRSAIASRNTRRSPTVETPNSFRSSAVRRGRTFSVIELLRKVASYFSRPRLRSQLATSMTSRPAQAHFKATLTTLQQRWSLFGSTTYSSRLERRCSSSFRHFSSLCKNLSCPVSKRRNSFYHSFQYADG